MTHYPDFFDPERIDQQVDRSLSASWPGLSSLEESSIQDQVEQQQKVSTRLIQELQVHYQDEYQQNLGFLEHAWQRIAARDPVSHASVQTKDAVVPSQAQNYPAGRISTFPIQSPPTPSFTGRARFQRGRLLVSSLVAVLLVGFLVTVLTLWHNSRSTPTMTSTPPAAVSPPPTFTPFPAQDCPRAKESSNIPWYQLCIAGKFVLINQAQSLSHGYTETIQAGYADRNMLILITDVSPIKATESVYELNEVAVEGSTLPEMIALYGLDHQQHAVKIVEYDTSQLPADLQTLTIKIHARASVSPAGASGSFPIYLADFTPFQVSLHNAQILVPNQTVIRQGVAVTLSKVVIGASGTHIVLTGAKMPYSFYNNGFTSTLKIGTQTISNSSYGLINEASTLPAGLDFTFEKDLTGMYGLWTLTVKQSDAQMIPPPSGAQPLVFQFSVPA